MLTHLAAHTPLLPGAESVTFVDIDDTVKRTYGYVKQGNGYGSRPRHCWPSSRTRTSWSWARGGTAGS